MKRKGNPVVHLFCDTNLLFQCKALEELDWSAWESFDVRLVVTKPVLREVDYRKTQGNSRVARRARAANSMFRTMRPTGEKVVCEAKPRVTLHVEPQHGYSAELADTLNYEERDDQLVGTLHRFAEDNPDADARLLTHDTTPLYTAEGLGLKAESIPDDWLLEPERDEQTKKVNELREEVARLRRAEPSFDIRFLDAAGNEAERFEIEVDLYDMLTEEEVGDLMDRLRRLHPMQTDFGPPKAKRASGTQLTQAIELVGLATGRVYDAPSDEKGGQIPGRGVPGLAVGLRTDAVGRAPPASAARTHGQVLLLGAQWRYASGRKCARHDRGARRISDHGGAGFRGQRADSPAATAYTASGEVAQPIRL